MNELIEALKAIESNPNFIGNRHDYLTNGTYDELHPLVQQVVDRADSELITNKGSCNWTAHDLLKKAGFPVTCGGRDSFGWLSGVIHTTKGMIVYG
jgi:hypothetical protein